MALLDLQGLNKLVNILHLRLFLMPAGTRGQLQQVLSTICGVLGL
nr:hypothetical protein Iba_scaffold14588CG0020 [Ipomoea batatas]